ncbi:restriction endonuclease S subunit [Cylindrospermum stagnale PCC 7417]|uniref:Restriction endonuclease S subunit n=1 Tax=Cylindrospermum stagnale PCC 7417 TaxID=56107 RepID=K9X5B1_9NOST|nr:restriction endonuclease subunit S [Cylindrospermum stagnale]AFZ27256.1 restriction endonuclease S subunit [Cylindrospermum stagnale PCC 7417]
MESNYFPNGWEMTTLSVIARKDGRGLVDGPFGSNLPASEYVPVGIPVIRGANLSLGDVRFKGEEFAFISDETAKRLERSLCSFDDIIFTKKGTLGQLGIIPQTHRYKKFLISSNQMKLSVDQDIASPLFVYYYLSSAASREKIIRDSEATGVPKTNLTYLRTFPILLPPLPEQKAIAQILSSLDDKIELNQQMNETLEAMARAMFKSWFVDFDPVRAKMEGRQPAGMDAATADLFPDEFEESSLGLIPKGWSYQPADTICSIGIGKTPPRKESEWFSTSCNDIRWVSIRDMGESGTFISDTKEYLVSEAIARFNVRVVPDHTVLLSFKLTIGRVAITDGEMSTNEAIAHFKLGNKVELSSEYLYLYLKTFDYNQLGSTSSIAEAVNSKIIKAMPILTTDSRLMEKFTNQVANIFARIKSNQRESHTLTTIRDTLLPKLMSGQIRVNQVEKLLEAIAA